MTLQGSAKEQEEEEEKKEKERTQGRFRAPRSCQESHTQVVLGQHSVRRAGPHAKASPLWLEQTDVVDTTALPGTRLIL